MSTPSCRPLRDSDVYDHQLYNNTTTSTSTMPAQPLSQDYTLLTQSTSFSPPEPPSNPSPQQPTTPLRGRYPHSLHRVPLHRRGTSKTYERLEDLLREAGYKETRIFTPETERYEPEAEEHARIAGTKGGMGMVVDFLAGLIPGGSRSHELHDGNSEDLSGSPTPRIPYRGTPSPPFSPLAHKQKSKATDSILDDSFRGPPLSRTSTCSSGYSDPHHPRPQHCSTDPSQTNSKAHLYLRHMSSAPTIHQGPTMTLCVQNKDESNRPPLPRTWLESVARAVLFGGTGAYVGGPVASVSSLSDPPPLQRAPSLRQTRSTLTCSPRKSKRALAEYTNIHLRPSSRLSQSHSRFATPAPALFARIQNTRSRRSEGEVSRTRVMCRSAPGSRNGSRVRDGFEWESDGHRGREKGRIKGGKSAGGSGSQVQVKGRGRERGRKMERDGVPSLASTTTEGDIMWNRGQGNDGRSRYLTGWGAETDTESDYDGQSSEEEGELDLAKMLVPPKRQNSIRSLRKHLAGCAPSTGRHDGSLKGSLRRKWLIPDTGNGDEDDEDDWGTRGQRKGVVDDEVDGGIFGGEGVGKRRTGLPVWRAG